MSISMKRSMRKLLEFRLPPGHAGNLVTLYADSLSWRVILVRFSGLGGGRDRYLQPADLTFDWETFTCTPTSHSPRPRRVYRPGSLIDLRELIGAPAVNDHNYRGTIRDGVIDEETLKVDSLIVTLPEGGGQSIVAADSCSWTPGEERHCTLPAGYKGTD